MPGANAVTNGLGRNYERGDLLCNGYGACGKSCAALIGPIYAHGIVSLAK
jgi:hypothetical protein